MARFDFGYSLGFSVVTSLENGATAKELRDAILKRLASLTDDELIEAVGAPWDTCEVWEG